MFDFESRMIKKGATSLRGKAALREIKWKERDFVNPCLHLTVMP